MVAIPTELFPDVEPDVEIDLRDGSSRPAVAIAAPDPAAGADPASPVRARRSPLHLVPAAIRRTLPVGGWVLAVAVLGLLVLPTLLGFSRYAIMGGSMSPTFERGSAVFSQDVPVDALRVGDVITYVPPATTGIDTFVTHRIAEIGEGEDGRRLFTTKGDANDAVDPWSFTLDADRQNVVTFSVPHLGTALTQLSDPDVRQLVIGIPAALIAGGAVLELLGFASAGELLSRLRRRQVALELVEEGRGGPV